VTGTSDLDVRRATAGDADAVLEVASTALEWERDERDREFFAWKHDDNPFGASPKWIALDGDRVVGFRTFLRWQLEREGRSLSAVRAVDTATDPEYQGRGIFTRLTLAAVDELSAEGTGAVFNTPNSKSRPGYLKMGWVLLGRPTLAFRPGSVRTAARMARSQPGADKWSVPVTIGEPAGAVVADVDARLRRPPPSSGWWTPRTDDYLRWRYGFEPLHYRAVEVRGGVCVLRVKRRAEAREVTICEWFSDRPDRSSLRKLVRELGDYAVGIGLSTWRHGTVPLPRRGPPVTWRALASPDIPKLSDLSLGAGDLELF
jgi:GNAT superfamily N-acetyltransferase